MYFHTRHKVLLVCFSSRTRRHWLFNSLENAIDTRKGNDHINVSRSSSP